MLKLIKYELRKGRASLLVMAGIALALFLMAPIGKWAGKEALIYTSVLLLAIYALAAYAFVLLRGITAYSRELKDRTGYLLFMIPKGAGYVLTAKLLFSLVFALIMLGASALALWGAGVILFEVEYELSGILDMMKFLLEKLDIDVASLLVFSLSVVLSVLGSVLVLVSSGYMVTSLAATLQLKKGMRTLLSILLYIAINVGMFLLTDAIQPEDYRAYRTLEALLGMQLVPMLLHLGLTLLYMLISSRLLKRRVAL